MHSSLNIPEKIYLKNPEETLLGKNIIQQSILMIDELGFEAFTFKKLAQQIQSTEASIYRYFENKHNLLVYLVSWYWSWLEYQIDNQVAHIEGIHQKLKMVIHIITETLHQNSSINDMNGQALHRIVVSESSKAYHTKRVDADNQEGFFKSYKSLCQKISEMMLELNPDYPYSHALSSTLLESAHLQVFFAQHLPSLTELKVAGDEYSKIIIYLEHLVFTQLKGYRHSF
jgi:AcrR family transcriptional regulator